MGGTGSIGRELILEVLIRSDTREKTKKVKIWD